MPEQYLPAPYEGMDVSIPAHLLPPTKSPYIRNFLCDGDRVVLRGPLDHKYALTAADEPDGTDLVSPGWMFPYWTGQILLLRTFDRQPGTSGATRRWWPWDSFDVPAAASGFGLSPTRGRVYFYDPDAGTLTAEAGVAGVVTNASAYGPHIAAFNDRIYAITTGHAHGERYLQYPDSTSTRFHRSSMLVRLPRQAGETILHPGPGATTGYNAPRFGQGLAAFAQRLWYLGGICSSPTIINDTLSGAVITGPLTGDAPRVLRPNTLWFTNVGTDLDPLLDDNWRTDNVPNSIIVGAETPIDYGMGLTSLSRSMVIHKRHSTWVLTGTGLDSFAIRQVSSTAGLVDPRARTVHEDVAYWVSHDGLRSYDGAEVRLLSAAINPVLRPAIKLRSGPLRESGSFVQLGRLHNDYLLLQTGIHDLFGVVGAAFDTVDQSWLYHIPTGRWTVFFTEAYGDPGAPAGIASDGPVVYQATTTGLYDMSNVTDPLGASYLRRGMDDIGSDEVSFPAECYFVPLRLNAPWLRGVIERYGIESIQEHGGTGTPGVGLLESQIVRYSRAALTGQEPTPTFELTSWAAVDGEVWNVSDVPEYLPAISNHDVHTELTDVQVRVRRDYSTADYPLNATWYELIGAYIEYRSTHERAT